MISCRGCWRGTDSPEDLFRGLCWRGPEFVAALKGESMRFLEFVTGDANVASNSTKDLFCGGCWHGTWLPEMVTMYRGGCWRGIWVREACDVTLLILQERYSLRDNTVPSVKNVVWFFSFFKASFRLLHGFSPLSKFVTYFFLKRKQITTKYPMFVQNFFLFLSS